MLSEELGLQKLFKGREGRPCSGSARKLIHQRGTTNEKSLDCRTCTDGSAKRRSLDERSILGVTFQEAIELTKEQRRIPKTHTILVCL